MFQKVKYIAFGAVIAAVGVCGCSTPQASVAPIDRAYCTQFRPIPWSVRDTDQTIKDVKAHNAVFTALCPEEAERLRNEQ